MVVKHREKTKRWKGIRRSDKKKKEGENMQKSKGQLGQEQKSHTSMRACRASEGPRIVTLPSDRALALDWGKEGWMEGRGGQLIT